MALRARRPSVQRGERSPSAPEIVDAAWLDREAYRKERERERKRMDRKLTVTLLLITLGAAILFGYLAWALMPGSILEGV
jgi:hypothetical protein